MFGDLGKLFLGQQDLAPTKAFNAGEQLSAAQGLLPQIGAFNQQLAQQQLGLIPIQNQMRGALYGEAINPLQTQYTQGILDNLNLGNQLPQDVQQQVLQNALQGSAASGFGLSPGGRALAGRDLGLNSLQIGKQRRDEALGALRSFQTPELRNQMGPQTALDLQMASFQDENNRIAQKTANENANYAAIMTSLKGYAETGGAIFGEVLGHTFGTSGMGKSMGGLGKFSGGAGQTYAGANGDVMTSSKATPVDNF